MTDGMADFSILFQQHYMCYFIGVKRQTLTQNDVISQFDC